MNNQERLEEEVKKAVSWLDSEQPEDAVLTHHGISLIEQIGTTKLSFTPYGAGGHPVFVFDDEREHDGYSNDKPRWKGYSEEEIDAFRQIVSRHAKIAGEWNGLGYVTYSIQLERLAGKSLLHCVQNYQRRHDLGLEYPWSRPAVPEGWH